MSSKQGTSLWNPACRGRREAVVAWGGMGLREDIDYMGEYSTCLNAKEKDSITCSDTW